MISEFPVLTSSCLAVSRGSRAGNIAIVFVESTLREDTRLNDNLEKPEVELPSETFPFPLLGLAP